MDILKGNFLINTKDEAVIANEIFRDAHLVGLYFSASWCPPCQAFLPQLKAIHEDARERRVNFEIIFVPSDSNNQRMTRYFIDNHGPWYALPVGPLGAALRTKLQVYRIPTLIIMNNKGKLITKDGRRDVEYLKDPVTFWYPESRNSQNENLA